jgi:hypothetical protein
VLGDPEPGEVGRLVFGKLGRLCTPVALTEPCAGPTERLSNVCGVSPRKGLTRFRGPWRDGQGTSVLQVLVLALQFLALAVTAVIAFATWRATDAARVAAESAQDQVALGRQQAALAILPRIAVGKPLAGSQYPDGRRIPKTNMSPIAVRVSATTLRYLVSFKSNGDSRAVVAGFEAFAASDPLAYEPPRREFLEQNTIHEPGTPFSYGNVTTIADASQHIRRFASAVRNGDALRFNVYFMDFIRSSRFIFSLEAVKPVGSPYWLPANRDFVIGWERWG